MAPINIAAASRNSMKTVSSLDKIRRHHSTSILHQNNFMIIAIVAVLTIFTLLNSQNVVRLHLSAMEEALANFRTRRRNDDWKIIRDTMFKNYIIPQKANCTFPVWDEKDRLVHRFDGLKDVPWSQFEQAIRNKKIRHSNVPGLTERYNLTRDRLPLEKHKFYKRLKHYHRNHVPRKINRTDHKHRQLSVRLSTRAIKQINPKKINPKNTHLPFRPDFNLCFIHIGKAAGSSIDCQLEHVRKHNPFCTDVPYDPTSAISRHTTCRKHMLRSIPRSFPPGTNVSHLINVRHPVSRMVSWYIWDHPYNIQSVATRGHGMTCGIAMIYTCYPTLNDLVTWGLDGPRPSSRLLSSSSSSSYYRVGTDLSDEECRRWAWGAVQGMTSAGAHNFFNYDFYTRPYWRKRESMIPRMYVLRAEYLWTDYETVDRMLGGEGKLPPGWNVSINEASSYDFVEKNKTMSERGLANLCRALCDEIQIYKKLIVRGVNLSSEDREVTLKELRDLCPLETSLETRECTY